MTIINFGESRPWNGRVSAGAVGDAGPYSDDQWATMYAQMQPYGQNPHAGIVLGSFFQSNPLESTQPLKIVATSPVTNAVQILPGAAICSGRWYGLQTAQNQAITANATGNPRIDAIVLRVDTTGQTVRPYYLVGTAAVTPAPPTIQATDVPLAYIEVASGFATIANSAIHDARQYLAPDRFSVQVETGASAGIAYEDGTPFIVASVSAYGAASSNRLGDHRVMGVNERYVTIGENDPTRMVSHGLTVVEVTGATSIGDYLEQSATAGRARPTTTPENAFAIALTTATTAGDKVAALVSPRIPNQPAYVKVSDVKASGANGGTFTLGAWRTRDLNTEDSDTAGIASVAANQITLAAGTYECFIVAPGSQVDRHKTRLQNITAGTTLLLGTSEYAAAAQITQTPSTIRGRFTLAVQSVLEVQHQSSATGTTSGFGIPTNIAAVNEVYTVAEFWRVLT